MHACMHACVLQATSSPQHPTPPACLTRAQAAAGAAAVPAKSLSDLPAYPADFVRRRLITFVGIVLGYSCFYLTRNSLTYTAPVMVGSTSLLEGAAAGTGRAACVPGQGGVAAGMS